MIVNFGRNIKFNPDQFVEPRSEKELLKTLSTNPGCRFRVVGSRHAWSRLIPTKDVCISLKHFNNVALTKNNDGRFIATVGGGCTIRRLLKRLNKHGVTMPSVGLMTSQTIAGAISTGTHGSGRHSLSHYIKSVRLAVIHPVSGRAVVKTFDRGPQLAAARCGLGSLGVLITVEFCCVSQYNAVECIQVVETVDEVLKLEHKYPIQQFYLIPHLDRLYVSTRREAHLLDGSPGLKAILYRMYSWIAIDIGYHQFVLLMGNFHRSRRFILWFYRKVFPRIILRNTVVVDRSDRILTMAHELFRHFETELFVKENHLHDVISFVRAAVNAFADRDVPVPEAFATSVNKAGMSEWFHQLRGSWVHHFAICVRKVLPDDTLISMAAGTESVYAISFITYDRDRRDFRNFSRFMTTIIAVLFDGRPHWGKHSDLPPKILRSLYPEFDRFNRIRQQLDPKGRFGNPFLDEIF